MKAWFLFLAVLWSVVQATAVAQEEHRLLYRIVTGRYVSAGGIWGVLTNELPVFSQTYVWFKADHSRGTAELSFVAEDKRSVFLVLTNGAISGGRIRFRCEVDHPYPSVRAKGILDYTVEEAGGELRIEGDSVFDAVCCDIPYHFAHRGVVGVLMPEVVIGVSEVEISWFSVSNVVYQVEYRSMIPDGPWIRLGEPLIGNGGRVCVTDRLKAGDSQRVYRVTIVP